MRHRARIVLAAASALGTTGCYHYAAVDAPRPGAEVRVQLTDAGTRDLAPALGGTYASLEGRLVSREDSALRVAVATVSGPRGPSRLWEGEQAVLVPAGAYQSMRQRVISRRKTGLLAGGAALAAALLISQVAGSGGEGGGAGGGAPGGGTPP